MKIKGYLLASISAISYGLIPLFILPIKAQNFSIDTTLFYRFFISSLLILGYLLYTKESLRLRASEWVKMGLLGVFYALSSECLFLGYDYLSPGIASTILFVYPVFVVLIMFLFFKEKITPLTAVSLVIALAGVLILSTKDSIFTINVLGLFITLLSALFYALYMIVVNKAKIEASGFKITCYSLFFASLYFLAKTRIMDESLAIQDVSLLVDFVLFALVTTVLSTCALVYAIKLIGSTPTSIVGALEPVVAVAVSVLLFDERISLNLFIGILLILTGVSLNILSDRLLYFTRIQLPFIRTKRRKR